MSPEAIALIVAEMVCSLETARMMAMHLGRADVVAALDALLESVSVDAEDAAEISK